MTPEQAWSMLREARKLKDQVRQEFPCHECDGAGEHYPGHHWDPCLECNGTGIHVPDEEDA